MSRDNIWMEFSKIPPNYIFSTWVASYIHVISCNASSQVKLSGYQRCINVLRKSPDKR